MDLFSIIVIILLILLLIAVGWLWIKNNKNNNNDDENNEEVSLVYHLSSETQEWGTYFAGIKHLKPAIINGNQLSSTSLTALSWKSGSHDSYMRYAPNDKSSNYGQQITQNYLSITMPKLGIMLDRAQFVTIDSKSKFFKCKDGRMFIQNIRKLSNNKIFYMCSVTQDWGGYLSENGYKILMSMFAKIKEVVGDTPFIICGDFNIQGWEAVADYVFGANNIYRPDTYKFATCDDNEGVASPDGIICSKNLVNRVEWWVERPSFETYQHFALCAKLYWNAGKKGVYQKKITDRSINERLKYVKENPSDKIFVGNPGKFDPNLGSEEVSEWNPKEDFPNKVYQLASTVPVLSRLVELRDAVLTSDAITITPPIKFISGSFRETIDIIGVPAGFKIKPVIASSSSLKESLSMSELTLEYDEGNVFNGQQAAFQLQINLYNNYIIIDCTVQA